MLAKRILAFSLLTAILLVAAGLFLITRPVQAYAGTDVTGESSSCLRCHENRYYNYDTGNHYCLTVASTRCVDCHAGDPEAVLVETAHTGLVIHPIINGDISRCESCHPQDALAHVETFAALAGYSPTVHVARQAEPSVSVATGEEAISPVLDAKVLAGISIILTVVAGLFVFCILTNKACHG